MKYVGPFNYIFLLVFFFFSLPVSSHDMLGSAESNEKSEWEVSCKDYVEVTKSGIYTAKTTIAALAYHWKLPKAEFEKHFLRDDSGQLRYDDSNIKPYTTNPTPDQFICNKKKNMEEKQTIITKPISYWKLTCNPKTMMTATRNSDHLEVFLKSVVGDAGPADPDIWKTYVQGLFDYNYKTLNGFSCPNNNFIRLILSPYDYPPDQTSGVTSSSTTAVLDCSTIPEEELTTIVNQAHCPNEIALREHQRNKNEEINKINEKLSGFEKSITKDENGRALASKILETDRYNEIVGEINTLKKEYKNYAGKEISDKLNDINALIKPIANFIVSYDYYEKICINNEVYKLQYSSPEDYSDKCSEINTNLKDSPITSSYLETSTKGTWSLEKENGFYQQYIQLRDGIEAYQANEKVKAADKKAADKKAADKKAADKKAADKKVADKKAVDKKAADKKAADKKAADKKAADKKAADKKAADKKAADKKAADKKAADKKAADKKAAKAAEEKAAKEKAEKKKAEKELRDERVRLDNLIDKINLSFTELDSDFIVIEKKIETKSEEIEEQFGENFDRTKPIEINLDEISSDIKSNISDYEQLIADTESLLKSITEDFDLESLKSTSTKYGLDEVKISEDFDLDTKKEEKIKYKLRLEDLNNYFAEFSQLIGKAKDKLGTIPESLLSDIGKLKNTIIPGLETEIKKLKDKYTFRIYFILLPIILVLAGGTIFLLIRLRSLGGGDNSPTSHKHLSRIQELEKIVARQEQESIKSDKIIKSIIDQKASTDSSQDRPGAIDEKMDEKPLDLKEQQRQEKLGLYKDYDDAMKDPNLVDQFREKWKAVGLERESRLATKGRAILRKTSKQFNQADLWTLNFNNRWIVFGGRILKVQAPSFAANDGRRARDLFKGIFQIEFGDDFRTARCAVVQKNNQIYEVSTEGRLQLPKID